MSPSRGVAAQLIGPGESLPRISLPQVPGADPMPLRSSTRDARVVVVLHDAACEACRGYLDRLAAATDPFRVWGGRPIVVVPEPATGEKAPLQRLPFPVLADADGEVRRRCGIPAEAAAVIVADRWGVVYHAVATPDERALPTPDEIAEWLKYLATQCAECGVPDEPGYGEWRE